MTFICDSTQIFPGDGPIDTLVIEREMIKDRSKTEPDFPSHLTRPGRCNVQWIETSAWRMNRELRAGPF
jgi:hypothetical protein